MNSKILTKFDICSKIPENFRRKVKLFHVFDDEFGFNLLFVTRDDDLVYGLGANWFGSLGLGHDQAVDAPELIPELCHHRVRQFVCGFTFVLAVTDDNRVYSWGIDNKGQLGRSTTANTARVGIYLRPDIIADFDDKHQQVSQLACGNYHSLALTVDGDVYGWGHNRYGQVGCGKYVTIARFTKIRLTNTYRLAARSVHCAADSSYALTLDGYVFSWGHNGGHQLGHREIDDVFVPKIMANLNNIRTVCPSGSRTLFLTNEGLLYFCGEYKSSESGDRCLQPTPQPMDHLKHQFIAMEQTVSYQRHISIKTATTGDGRVWQIFNTNELQETSYQCFDDFYAQEMHMTYRTVVLDDNNIDHQVDGDDSQEDNTNNK
ncbi:RCC1 and BTB domain-containing protein 1-like, partial [Oppia nitens]|uniref:RCC1 and BTB domain-containing protein 1-like n=1 Tax=Oppia nitens TaxID=1686743 RepID=UPI0023DAD996